MGPGDERVIVTLSHLRWDWVWQRPQHLMARLGRGRTTLFVEEPVPCAGLAASRAQREEGDVTRLWLEVPSRASWLGFNDADLAAYQRAIDHALPRPRPPLVVWLYTALAFELGRALEPDLIVYDVMDDLASFKDAAPEQRLRHHAALHHADVVFTGGRSLHAAASALRPRDIHCFPSGVEAEHFGQAKVLRRRTPGSGGRPVIGYVGVLDERIDWDLVGDVADLLPDWTFTMVGPVAKIDPARLPVRRNVHYTGPRAYGDLPAVMASFDVAMMPFARNEATRSISPTKTLEYLAAGLPVVSTSVPDVVADHASIVGIADMPSSFAAACVHAMEHPPDVAAVARVVRRSQWDDIAARMGAIVDERLAQQPERVANA